MASDDLSTDRHAPHHSSIVNVLATHTLGALTVARARKDILSIYLNGCQDHTTAPPGSFHHETVSVGDQQDRCARAAGEGAEGSGDIRVALPTEEREHEVAGGGHDLGCGAGADRRAILVEGDVADVVQPVLDAPMAPDQGEQASGIGALGRQAGDVVGRLDAGRAGRDAALDRDAVPFEATDLADVGPRRLVGPGATEPAQDPGVTDRPERPQLAPSVADFRLSLEDASDPPALVAQPAWGDRDAGPVAGRGQPRGKTPPRPPTGARAGWRRPAGRRRPPAR
jgi:hypothetical protein